MAEFLDLPPELQCSIMGGCRLFTRSDFLVFGGNDSVETFGNKEVYLTLDGGNGEIDPIEEWNRWQDYPKFAQILVSQLKNDIPTSLMAWLVHNFAPIVCAGAFATDYASALSDGDTVSMDWLTVDDFAFIFVTVQHNINYWHRYHWRLQQQRDKARTAGNFVSDSLLKVDTTGLGGCEFKNGSGISGVEGQRRYKAMTKFLSKAYYKNTDEPDLVVENRKALMTRLVKMVRDDEQRAMEASGADQATSQPKKKAKRRRESSEDEELNDILTDQWSQLARGGFGSVAV